MKFHLYTLIRLITLNTRKREPWYKTLQSALGTCFSEFTDLFGPRQRFYRPGGRPRYWGGVSPYPPGDPPLDPYNQSAPSLRPVSAGQAQEHIECYPIAFNVLMLPECNNVLMVRECDNVLMVPECDNGLMLSKCDNVLMLSECDNVVMLSECDNVLMLSEWNNVVMLPECNCLNVIICRSRR